MMKVMVKWKWWWYEDEEDNDGDDGNSNNDIIERFDSIFFKNLFSA